MEVHRCSTLETAFVDVRTVVEIRTLQVEKGEADKTVASLVGVEIQVLAGSGSVVAVALGVDTGYSEVEVVAGENTLFVAVVSTYSAGSVGWRPRTANWCCYPAFPSRRRDHGRVAVEGIVCRVVMVVVEGVVCRTARVAVGAVVCTFVRVVVELVETVPPRIGEATSRGLTNCTDSGKVVEAERW